VVPNQQTRTRGTLQQEQNHNNIHNTTTAPATPVQQVVTTVFPATPPG
jgi:hypothetical protein